MTSSATAAAPNRDQERARKRRDATDAGVIDAAAAPPPAKDKRVSNLQAGISPWNARPKLAASAAYWSPLPDPEPKAEQEWRKSISDTGWRVSRH